ncbi:MAG TPA: hypothetical protein VK488_11135 [Gaiellaceae bacterium]|nr:hypothetical protein [Gaiellaceae bacterium]
MNAVRVPWSSASFLVYFGGLTIFASGLALLAVQGSSKGEAGFVLWAAIVLAAFLACAEGFRRTGHAVAAGLFAFNSVWSSVVLVGALENWFGWLANSDSPFGGFHLSLLLLELVALVGAVFALTVYRFPLLSGLAAAAGWFFVTDLISNGGNWTAIVTIAVGLVLLGVGVSVDGGPSRPFGFWVHVVAGLTIGGGLLWFFHSGDFEWFLIAVAALAYVALGDRLMRSSWVVLSAWGLLQVATHFSDKWSGFSGGEFFPLSLFLFPLFGFGYGDPLAGGGNHVWVPPVTYAILGFVFVAIGLFIARRRRDAIPAAELL